MSAWKNHPTITAHTAKLSDREREAFLLFCQGYSPNEVAISMGLSIKTASTYRARIRDKTGVFATREFVYLALQAAEMTPPELSLT